MKYFEKLVYRFWATQRDVVCAYSLPMQITNII